MTLVKAGLKTGIKAIQDGQPKSIPEAAQRWAQAIHSYSASAMAGAVLPTTLMPATLQAKFVVSMNAKKWMENLGADLLSWWSPVAWAGPGFTGVTVPAPPMNSKSIGDRIKSGEVSDVAGLLSDEIDKWTKTLKVTLTNVSSGATSLGPVS